jgi:hypothetical protein
MGAQNVTDLDDMTAECSQFITTGPLSTEWECELFGTGPIGIILTPKEDRVPNWFWRQMQFLILGNKWVRKRK